MNKDFYRHFDAVTYIADFVERKLASQYYLRETDGFKELRFADSAVIALRRSMKVVMRC